MPSDPTLPVLWQCETCKRAFDDYFKSFAHSCTFPFIGRYDPGDRWYDAALMAFAPMATLKSVAPPIVA